MQIAQQIEEISHWIWRFHAISSLPTSSWTTRNLPPWLASMANSLLLQMWEMIWEWNGLTKTLWMKMSMEILVTCFWTGIRKIYTQERWKWQIDICWHCWKDYISRWKGKPSKWIHSIACCCKKPAKHPEPDSVWRFHGWNWCRWFRYCFTGRNMACRKGRSLQNKWWTQFISEWFTSWSCWCRHLYFQNFVLCHVGCHISCIVGKALRPTFLNWTEEIPDFCMLFSHIQFWTCQNIINLYETCVKCPATCPAVLTQEFVIQPVLN